MAYSTTENESESSLFDLESQYKNLTQKQLAEKAVDVATNQIMACFDFKKPRITRVQKYWDLYDGKVPKKLRQLFNVPIPVFPGMVDTLNAQYDTSIQLKFKEGDASDYFKVQKLNGAYQNQVLDSAENSKWDEKLTLARAQAIIAGRAILEYQVGSDPEYYSELDVIGISNFNFQPRGGGKLENHLFAGTEDVEKTKSELIAGAVSGYFDKEQVRTLLSRCADRDYLPNGSNTMGEKLNRFKALGLNAEDHSYVGESVYKLANHVLNIDGKRYYLCFHPWTKTWLRFERLTDTYSSDLYPWVSYATHPNDENFLSKSFADDMYPASDAIVAMFNQELTNREKRNFGARAYDKDMFTDVRKLDEAQHRPDALVPADTKNGTRRISEGIYEFKVGELGGTVNLIDWITGTVGRNTGASDLAQGSVQEVSKKASVTFAEQKSVSKRIGWSSKPFQGMMADLGKRFIYGLKDHMPSTMAIKVLGEGGWDWDEITRLDLDTKKDVNVMILSTDQQMQDSEIKAKRRSEALSLLINSQNINGKKRDEEILRSVGDYEDLEVAEFLDVKTYSDRKSIAKASVAIEMMLRDETPDVWYGATIAFIQKIKDYADDKRSTLGAKYKTMIDYAMSHTDIVKTNIERKVSEQATMMPQEPVQGGTQGAQQLPQPSGAENPGIPGGMSHAMSIAEQAV
jgi:hypothetical protein